MSDEPLPDPDDEAVPSVEPGDPFEADLVAYLDGELDEASSRQVESRLASDPAAREKAATLKKTFDLLDYLPRPETSATFTTRTLEKIPALNPATVSPQGQAQSTARSTSQPVILPSSMSSSVPVALKTSELNASSIRPGRKWLLAAGVLLAVTACAAAGYFGAAALRPNPSANHLARDSATEAPSLADRRLIGNLPLYAAADNFEFVQSLSEADFFGDEPSVSFDAVPKVPTVEPESPTDAAFEILTREFKELPAARQQEIRDLDRQLQSQNAPARDRLMRVLEAYTIWLERLPDSERKGILAAATPGLRLGVIRDIRERKWLDSLPAAQRNQLNGLSVADKGIRISDWKKAEAERREEWGNYRIHADSIAANRTPWPFDDEKMRQSVIEYMRTKFKTDDPKKSRLKNNEFDLYKATLASAEKTGGWAWYDYGRLAFNLARTYDRYLLPEPADSKQLYQDFGDLPPLLGKMVGDPRMRKKLAPHVGSWPDFPLEIHDELRGLPGKFGPGPPLGPARVSDFKEPVRSFYEKELSPRLSGQERVGLRMVENRWPEYPREFIRLARTHDLSIPSVTLPGSPRKWSETYGGGRFGRP